MSREAGPLAVVAAERLRGATATRCAQQDVREHSARGKLTRMRSIGFYAPSRATVAEAEGCQQI